MEKGVEPERPLGIWVVDPAVAVKDGLGGVNQAPPFIHLPVGYA